MADTTKAIELAPGVASAWVNRGVTRGRRGDLEGEIADTTKAIEVDARYATAWSSRAWARAQRGDLDGAISDYERFLEIAPAHRSAPAVRHSLAELKAKRAR